MSEAKRVYANYLHDKIEERTKEWRQITERHGRENSAAMSIMGELEALAKEFESL